MQLAKNPSQSLAYISTNPSPIPHRTSDGHHLPHDSKFELAVPSQDGSVVQWLRRLVVVTCSTTDETRVRFTAEPAPNCTMGGYNPAIVFFFCIMLPFVDLCLNASLTSILSPMVQRHCRLSLYVMSFMLEQGPCRRRTYIMHLSTLTYMHFLEPTSSLTSHSPQHLHNPHRDPFHTISYTLYTQTLYTL
jgi:hypothetical protein